MAICSAWFAKNYQYSSAMWKNFHSSQCGFWSAIFWDGFFQRPFFWPKLYSLTTRTRSYFHCIWNSTQPMWNDQFRSVWIIVIGIYLFLLLLMIFLLTYTNQKLNNPLLWIFRWISNWQWPTQSCWIFCGINNYSAIWSISARSLGSSPKIKMYLVWLLWKISHL